MICRYSEEIIRLDYYRGVGSDYVIAEDETVNKYVLVNENALPIVI